MRRLTAKLLIAVILGLVSILAAQTAIRYRIELPVLQRLEALADAKAVDRLRQAFGRRVDELERFVVDYGNWDLTWRFMTMDARDPEAAYFRDSEIGLTAHQNNNIHGIVLADPDGEVRHATQFDLQTGLAEPPALDFAALFRGIAAETGGRAAETPLSGIARTNLGHVLFASGPIRDTEHRQDSRGVMVAWRRLDAGEFDELRRVTGMRFEFIPAATARDQDGPSAALAALGALQSDLLPRNRDNDLYWLLDDAFHRPAFLVRQAADPRAFTDELFSPSFLAGFASSALIVLLFAIYFSRMFVAPLTRATSTMRRWRHSGRYDELIEYPHGRRDELTEMFQHFNALIERVRQQETDLKEQNRQLAELSQQDSLTGIPNRRFLAETLDRFWRQAVRAGRPISVLMIDVDYFKPFNDRYGHQVGDRVLRQVAQTLQENLHRATDFVARYGGEEFCVLLTDTAAEDARRVAEGLRAAVKALGIRHAASRCSDVVTVSIGIAAAEPDQTVVHLDLIKEADEALYNAKAAGRDCVSVAETLRTALRE